jgi:hypothetical protein
MAYVKSGQHASALHALEAGLEASPADRQLAEILARLLSTATDANVRDGKAALKRARELYLASPDIEAAQTYAMALAATGDFGEAQSVQTEVVAAALRSNRVATLNFAVSNLARFKDRLTVLSGWAPDDPLLRPRSGAVARPAAPPRSQ